jgi:hypothetical protein
MKRSLEIHDIFVVPRQKNKGSIELVGQAKTPNPFFWPALTDRGFSIRLLLLARYGSK